LTLPGSQSEATPLKIANGPGIADRKAAVKPPPFDYYAPTGVGEALALLAEHGDDARLLAGGQSLMPALNLRLTQPSALIDLARIDSLATVEDAVAEAGAEGPGLAVGAMTRHRYFETSPLIARRFPLLHHAVRHIAHVQIRNRGTIGGSLCHADPAAEWPALCIVCDATMELRGPDGVRGIPAAQFVQGLFTTALAPGEMLVRIDFPGWPGQRRWGFQEVARRHGDFALIGVVCAVELDGAGVCGAARVVVFGGTACAAEVPSAAAALIERNPSAAAVREAARAARREVVCHGDHHASAEYRSELVEALTARALAQALALELPR
jgi:carbon-monoxide dehydrogenase medium subunit